MKLPSLFAAIAVATTRSTTVQSQLLRPKQASPDTPWEELRSTLSSPDILNLPTPMDWKEECLDPMLFEDELPSDPFQIYGYDIGYKPSGVCMVHMSCAYDGCNYYFSGAEACPPDQPDCWMLNRALSPPFDTTDLHEDRMELPAAVLHPRSASDVVRGIEFANRHDIGVTVKVVGHSFFGSSTARGTLLIKMSTNYPQYGIEGSLTECESVDSAETADWDEASIDACTVAVAKGKPAFLRVGGGELFDTAYRAVFFDWNENPANANKYHFVGGFCGTVSAAGGWVQSGGLSGASMRLHGIGVDQVLQIEMVLPSGKHVRFGPTEWEKQEGDQALKTVTVTGYCNAVPYETEESLWEWTPCNDETISFEDLWFAVRGGGGGTFGIVTSLYYMLHDLPGKVQSVEALDPNLETRIDAEKTYSLIEDYLRFALRYLYLPETLGNITELESRSCNSPGIFSNFPFGSTLYCHNSAGNKFIEEWKKYLETDCITCEKYGDDQELMTALDNLFFVKEEYPSQGYVTVMDDGPYAGRLQDDAGVLMLVLTGTGLDHVPLYTLENHFDDLISILMEETRFGTDQRFYLMGGAVPSSSDQMDSIGPLRREAAFSRRSQQPSVQGGSADLYEKFYELVWRDIDTTTSDFPGIFCHNHASNEAIGPLKSDWTKPCPSLLEASQAEREELCVSQAESFWGTVNVALLEDIKKMVDPTNMFVCNAGISAATPYKIPEETDSTGGCAEAAGCFDDTGCSVFDQSTQTWSGAYAACIDAIECAVFFPDSPCFFNNSTVSPVVCTDDVFECDDGSFVSRNPENCQFPECPTALPCDEDVFECDDGSFVSRNGMNNCEFEECPSLIACSADVFECDDGSFVSRNGMNNCEFEECPPTVVCSADVFECDDGSFVSRNGMNNCEFEECPPTVVCSADVKECDDGSFVSRDAKNDCQFLECPPIACTRDIIVCDDGSNVVRDPMNNCEFPECPTDDVSGSPAVFTLLKGSVVVMALLLPVMLSFI